VQEKSGLKYVVWIIRGLLWLLEAILKFINRNAFIMVAVKGERLWDSGVLPWLQLDTDGRVTLPIRTSAKPHRRSPESHAQSASHQLNCSCQAWQQQLPPSQLHNTHACAGPCAGKSYCNSAARATVLLVANALRVGAVNIIGDFLIFMGKLAVAAGCGVAAMLLTNLQLFSDPGEWTGASSEGRQAVWSGDMQLPSGQSLATCPCCQHTMAPP
jgi:hypothetical protein